MADEVDVYDKDEFDVETGDQNIEESTSNAEKIAMTSSDAISLPDDENFGNPEITPPKRAYLTKRRHTNKIPSVLDQSPWTFLVHAKRIRGLRVPVTMTATTESIAGSGGKSPIRTKPNVFPRIRDLRVFAVMDKQPIQSGGSRWKKEGRATLQRPSIGNLQHAQSSLSRSGYLEEASWRDEDGTLQWTFTRDRFARLKAYNPRIKLFVFGIGDHAQPDSVRALSEDSPTKHQDSIISLGWFFLDMRTPDLPNRWFKLQNARYGGEIYVGSSFTPAQSEMSSIRNNDGQLSASDKNSLSKLECLRIGASNGTDIFLVSIFLRGARQLCDLVSSTITTKSAGHGAGYWLSYSLFDVVVQTDEFYDVDEADFSPIRDSFRVQSCVEDLREFFMAHDTLRIYLCTENKVLATATIPLNALADKISTTINAHTISGEYALVSESNVRNTEACVVASCSVEKISGQSTVHDAMVDVETRAMERTIIASSLYIDARHVELDASVLAKYANAEGIVLELLVGGKTVTQPVQFGAMVGNVAIGGCREPFILIDWEGESKISLSCTSTESKTLVATTSEALFHSESANEVRLTLYQDGIRVGDCILTVSSQQNPRQPQSESTTRVDRLVASVTHHYQLSLKLKSLRDFDSPHRLLISYRNPFTGLSQVESTCISVPKKAEIQIADADCDFWLYESHDSIRHAMESAVVMKFFDVLSDGTRQIVGQAIFSLNYLFFSEETFCCADLMCGKVFKNRKQALSHWAQAHTVEATQDKMGAHIFKSCSIDLPIMSTVGSVRVGMIQMVAYLEDLGSMTNEDVEIARKMFVPSSIQLGERQVDMTGGLNIRKQGASQQSPTKRESSVHASSKRAKKLEANNAIAEVFSDQAVLKSSTHNEQEQSMDEKLVELQTLQNEIQQLKVSWKQDAIVEQDQWKKRFAEMEKTRMNELEEEWARREEERSSLLRTTQNEYQRLEQKLRTTLSDVETRERKLALAEAALERDKRLHREDAELLMKRLQSEQSHAVSLAQRHVDSLQKQVAELQGKLSVAEKRTLQVESDFSEYRAQQRKIPESKLREEVATLKAQLVEVEKVRMNDTRKREEAEANVAKMREQLEKMARLVQTEKKKNETRVVDDLEKLRLKYIAREERYVLDGDREELKAIKKQLDDLRHFQLAPVGAGYRAASDSIVPKVVYDNEPYQPRWSSSEQSSPVVKSGATDRTFQSPDVGRQNTQSDGKPRPKTDAGSSPIRQPHDENMRQNKRSDNVQSDQELQRLERERTSLLASGAYNNDHYLIRELDRRIMMRQDQLLHT